MSIARPRRPLPNDVISIITCTGQLSWFPDPEDLECVEQCGEVNKKCFTDKPRLNVNWRFLKNTLSDFTILVMPRAGGGATNLN